MASKQPKNIKKKVKKKLKRKVRRTAETAPKRNKADHLEHHKWKKGCPSPNPSGRPKGSLSLTTALRVLLSKKGKSKKEKYKELIEKLFEQATEGDAKLMQLIFDRIDGKVPDRLFTTETNPLSEADEGRLNEIIHAGEDRSDESAAE